MTRTLFTLVVLTAPAVEARTPMREFAGFGVAVHSVTFSPDGKSIAARGLTGNVRVWDAAGGKRTLFLPGEGAAGKVAFSSDGKRLFTLGGGEDTVTAWDAATGKKGLSFTAPPKLVIFSIAVSPDGKTVGTGDIRLRLWDAATGKPLRKLADDRVDGCRIIAFSRDGRQIASGGIGVKAWDVGTGKALPDFPESVGLVSALAFSADGERLYAGSSTQGLYELSVKDGTLLRAWNTGRGGATAFALSPDGYSLAVADGLGSTQVYELATLKARRFFTTDTKGTSAVAFAPDGRSIATGGQDRVVRQWDVTEGWAAADLSIPFTEADFKEHWAALAGDDASRAYNAVWALATRSKESVPFLAKQLAAEKGPALDAARIGRLITALDDDTFEKREAATRELEKVGSPARRLLERAMKGPTSLEQRARLEKLLKALGPATPTAEELRRVRAAEALGKVNTPDARRILEKLKADDWR